MAARLPGYVHHRGDGGKEGCSPQVHPLIKQSLEDCKEVFGGKVALFSNSAGLEQFDPQGPPPPPPDQPALQLPPLPTRTTIPAQVVLDAQPCPLARTGSLAVKAAASGSLKPCTCSNCQMPAS